MDAVTQDQLDHVRNGGVPEGALLFETVFWTSGQVRKHLGISFPTFDLWVAKGAIPITRFNGQRFLTSEQVRIAARHAKASCERRGVIFKPGELGEPTQFKVD